MALAVRGEWIESAVRKKNLYLMRWRCNVWSMEADGQTDECMSKRTAFNMNT